MMPQPWRWRTEAPSCLRCEPARPDIFRRGPRQDRRLRPDRRDLPHHPRKAGRARLPLDLRLVSPHVHALPTLELNSPSRAASS